MPFIRYENHKFRADALGTIEQANRIIEEYQGQGFILTLRQLYYQFVARGLRPNTQQSYKSLGQTINKGRMAGLIDWNAIEDRTRNIQSNSHWSDPGEIVQTCADQFRLDLWEGQPYRPEVWIEKEALVGVIAGVCEELDISFFACRGYVSQSEQWRAGRRFGRQLSEGQVPVVLHLGDHDPSGIDMTRDNHDRLFTFAQDDVEVKRLALNMDQVEEFNPPPNPAKVTDSRFERYAAEYGDESWELDALEPAMLVQLIRDNVAELVDPDLMEERAEMQREARVELTAVAERWQEAVEAVA